MVGYYYGIEDGWNTLIETTHKQYVWLVWFEPDYASERPEAYPSLQGVWDNAKAVPSLYKEDKDYDVIKEEVQGYVYRD